MQLEVAGGNMLIYLLCRAGATTELTGLQHLGLNSTILRVVHTKAPSQREWRQNGAMHATRHANQHKMEMYKKRLKQMYKHSDATSR